MIFKMYNKDFGAKFAYKGQFLEGTNVRDSSQVYK